MKTANSNRKKTRTSASRMRAESSSVYRKVEQLLFWAMTVIDRTPNTTSFRSLGEKAMLDLEDSLDLIDLALHTKDDEQLLKFLEALSIRMRDIKTIFRIYWEKSKNIPERNIDEIVAMYPGTDIDVLLRVTKQTIMNNPQENCVKRGNLDLWDQLIAISPSKSFFSNKTGQGLPIGNITSQLIANFLLSFLDEYIISLCRQVGAVHLRFVDDIAIVARRPEDIVWIRGNVATYMVKVLHQKLHAYKFYLQEVHKGGKFVGSVIKPGRIYTSNRTLGRFQDKVSSLEELCTSIVTEGITLSRAAALEEFIAGINSYFGFTSHTASYNRRMRIFNQQVYFWKVCYLVNASKAKIRKKYKLSTFLIHQEYEEYISHKTSAPRGHSESLPSEGANRQF